MRLGFVLYMYFPYGGLQRDFLRIATVCRDRGHQVIVYTMGWEGAVPEGFEVECLPVRALSNHRRNEVFFGELQRRLQESPVDAVIGFNKMPGLDVYYAADPCFEARSRQSRSTLYRRSRRYKVFKAYEQAVFGKESATEILMIAEQQIGLFQQYYHTERARFHLLPPGISRDRMAPDNAPEIRAAFRDEFELADEDRLVLMVGSGFRTKGLDRALEALGALPAELRSRTRFFIIGQDNASPFRRQIRRLKIAGQVRFLFGRDDVPRFLLGADLLIHPAYSENTGTVLLEAIVAGLPVLVTDICGYAHYVSDAQAGQVLPSPFDQRQLNARLAEMLQSDQLAQWSANGVRFGREADLYSMPERAADVIESVLARKQAH